MPTVFLPIEDVQDQFLAGQPLASTIVVRGQPAHVAPELDVLTTAQVKDDLDRPLAQTSQTLDIINALLWIMAAGTIAAMVYLTALERTRDFAVLKATGASRWSMLGGLAIEATALSIFAAIVGSIMAAAISPSFPFPVETPLWAYTQLSVVALVVGLVASLAGLRRIAAYRPGTRIWRCVMPVRIRDLSIEYSSGGYRVRPIDHLDLDIEDGQIVLLLGASGCGKTTLLSALAAILTPSSGTIEVNGDRCHVVVG